MYCFFALYHEVYVRFYGRFMFLLVSGVDRHLCRAIGGYLGQAVIWDIFAKLRCNALFRSITEVWGKVVFSQASVILSTRGGGFGFPACITSHMTCCVINAVHIFVNCASISALFQMQYLEFYSTYQSALSL